MPVVSSPCSPVLTVVGLIAHSRSRHLRPILGTNHQLWDVQVFVDAQVVLGTVMESSVEMTLWVTIHHDFRLQCVCDELLIGHQSEN